MLRFIRGLELLLAIGLVVSGPLVAMWISSQGGTKSTMESNLVFFGVHSLFGLFFAGIILVHIRTGSAESVAVMWAFAVALAAFTGLFIFSLAFLTVAWAYFMVLAALVGTIGNVLANAEQTATMPMRTPDRPNLAVLRRRHMSHHPHA